ncbi:MAG: LysM peptidoglycan-binding domain-containing protein [Bacteroidales bacterium]|nr:LysM peptidoglycan-binding domain-containing protein [Bacteroidales bacterium]MCF8400614.1 LysM peptidoglycan-binding domain-containing protein [Bacteroidales bacterium]
MMANIKLFLVISCFLVPGMLPAQGVQIEKSTEIELIEGKTYYIHHVEKGHTLYSIAKVYELPLDDILFENPEAKNGLAIGQLLKIPVQSREKDILKTIEEKDFDFFYHVAQSGEDYADVARIYLVSEFDLKEANPELEEPFKEGEYVKVPVFRKDKDPGPEVSDILEDEGKKDKTVESDDDFRHVVKKGETLYRISKMYGIGVQELLAINPGLSPDIKEGQLIRIPGKSKTKATDRQNDDKYYHHVVESDENLYRIALRFKVSIDTLRKLNPGIDDRPRAGQIIKIPIDTGKKSYINHTVEEKKEKLKKIAKKYGLELSELKRMNPTMRGRVYRGQIVRIPVSYEREPFADIIIDMEEKQDTLSEIETDTLFHPLDRPKILRETYEVALMLPFYLEQVDSLHPGSEHQQTVDLSFTPFRFIQFYEGFLLAADSLRNNGLSVNLHVYDVGPDVSKTIKVLQEPELKEMDLIVGPLYSNSFNLAANFAQLFEIPIVNPLTFRQEVIKENANVFKVQPSLEKQVEQVVQFILENHPGAKILLVRDNKYQNSQVVADFRQKLQDSIPDAIAVPNYVLHNILIEKSENRQEDSPPLTSVQIEDHLVLRDAYKNSIDDTTYFDNYVSEITYMEDSIAGIQKHASVIRDNVIITITEDRVFMLDFLTKLNVLRDTFNLVTIGLPDWEKHMDFAPALFQNLNVHLFLPSYIDYDEIVVGEFVKKFRKNYNTEPNTLAFLGYDIAYFFMRALQKYGLSFPDYIPHFKTPLLQTKFYFIQDSPFNGYENLYWNIIKYEDYSIKELSNPWYNQQNMKKQKPWFN